MALSDLLYPISLFPPDLLLFYVDSWPLSGPVGEALCKLVDFLPSISTVVSIESLVLIAVDRFGAVVFPLRSPLISSKLCPYFILATWIVAMTVCSPLLIANQVIEHQEKLFCVARWKDSFGEHSSAENYGLSIYVVFLYIPIILLTIIYSIIIVNLRTRVFPGEHSVNIDQLRMKRNNKVLKMALAIVVGFVISWFPFSVIRLLAFHARDTGQQCYILFIWFITNFLAVSNCAINPCICLIFSTSFRRRLKVLLKCFGTRQE